MVYQLTPFALSAVLSRGYDHCGFDSVAVHPPSVKDHCDHGRDHLLQVELAGCRPSLKAFDRPTVHTLQQKPGHCTK